MKLENLFESKWTPKDAYEYVIDMVSDGTYALDGDRFQPTLEFIPGWEQKLKKLSPRIAKMLDAVEGEFDFPEDDDEEDVVDARLEAIAYFLVKNKLATSEEI